MKKIFLLFSLLISITVYSQNSVDIKITEITSNSVNIELTPAFYENSVLSNIVFTLRWKNNKNLSLGNPQSTELFSISKSGPILTNDIWKYQIYSGLGFTPSLIGQSITLSIPKSGNGKIVIASDEFINNIINNGNYYVSIGGQDVTGEILNNKIVDLQSNSSNQRKLYYSQELNQFLFEINGEFTTTLGHKINILDKTTLVLIKKIE